MSTEKRLKPSQERETGILNERILLLIFNSIKWEIHTLCTTASVNRKLRAVAKRLLWREMCVYRAPSMTAALTDNVPSTRVSGGWDALAKLMFFCCGWEKIPGHFAKSSRFSKTSGKSFLMRKCRSDLLYISDPCEHKGTESEDDLGIYRGVFREFMRSRTRECLIRRGVGFEDRERCSYCGARVWSMSKGRLVPKSAARRLGSRDGGVEYFVCLNGHLYGTCWLVPLSSDEGDFDGNEDEEDSDFDDDFDDGFSNGSSSLTGKGGS